jgi:hypothetical protein
MHAEFGQCTVTLVSFFTEAAVLPSFATNAERWTAGVRRSSQGREALHRGRMATMDAPAMRLFLAQTDDAVQQARERCRGCRESSDSACRHL